MSLVAVKSLLIRTSVYDNGHRARLQSPSMLRDKLRHHEPVDGLRWRSHEITRVEGFSDAVFGFAVTLLSGRSDPRSRLTVE